MVNNNLNKNKVVDGDDNIDFFDSRNNAVNDANDADNGSYSKGAPATKKKRKKRVTMKTGGKRSTKRNKTCWHKNTTINPDLVLRSGEGDADSEEGNADGYSGGDDNKNLDNNYFEEKRYKKRRQKIGQSTLTDNRGGRFIGFLSKGQQRHFSKRYPMRS